MIDKNICQTPFVTYPSIECLTNEESREKVIADMCGFLNSLGGVLLFDIKRVEKEYRAIGSLLS